MTSNSLSAVEKRERRVLVSIWDTDSEFAGKFIPQYEGTVVEETDSFFKIEHAGWFAPTTDWVHKKDRYVKVEFISLPTGE